MVTLKKHYQKPKLKLIEIEGNQTFMVGSNIGDEDATGSGEDFPWHTPESMNFWK